MKMFQNNFTGRLRELRGKESQTKFSEKLGIPQTSYSNYERGAREPEMDFLAKISTRFGVSVDWLLGLTNERNPGRQVVTATGGSVAAGGNATAHIHAPSLPPLPTPDEDRSRLLSIIESQQRVIESLTATINSKG